MTAICSPPFSELLPGATLHLYLSLGDGICVVQGRAVLVSHHWLAERCVPLVQPLQLDAHYHPAAAGWVLLRALPGAAVQLQRLSAPAATPPKGAFSRVLQFLGFAPLTLKAAP
jgi:hypothetical protein